MRLVTHLLPAVLLVALALPPSADAFSVEDHRALTEAALAPGTRPGLVAHREAVLHGATSEDLNLHVKWTGWHHFYRPDASLDTVLRQGAAARVARLWEEALEAARRGDLARAYDRAGHLAHHLEDVASPPHVVPVNHGLTDRFERYGVRASLARLPAREVAPLSGGDAQRALALETLDAVRTGSLPARDGAIPWTAFWAESAALRPGAFGHYGAAGNAFGKAEVRWRGRTWAVDPEGYAAFMDARAAAAVAYTRAFLEWASDRIEDAAARARGVASSDRTADAAARARDIAPSGRSGFRPPPELSFSLVGGLAGDSRGTAPVLGLRAALPLPRALRLSVDWTRSVGAGGARGQPGGGWAVSVLSPPLWTARLGDAGGVDVRARVGLGRFAWDGGAGVGVPLGLGAQARLGGPWVAGLDVLYQGGRPGGGAWVHGFAWTVGLGVALGDR